MARLVNEPAEKRPHHTSKAARSPKSNCRGFSCGRARSALQVSARAWTTLAITTRNSQSVTKAGRSALARAGCFRGLPTPLLTDE